MYNIPDVSKSKEPLMSNHIDKSWKLVPRRDQFSMTNNMRHTMNTTYASNRLYISVFNFTGAKIIKKVVSEIILTNFFMLVPPKMKNTLRISRLAVYLKYV